MCLCLCRMTLMVRTNKLMWIFMMILAAVFTAPMPLMSSNVPFLQTVASLTPAPTEW